MDTNLKNELLKLFKAFIDFCNQHQLTYYAAYGTALGAVRHKGMIPWDDDIDVCMPRKDYERFLQLRRTLNNTPYYIMDISDKAYYLCFAKFCKRNSAIIEREGEALMGLYIDVFPLDNYDEKGGKYLQNINWVNRILWIIYGRSYRTYCSAEIKKHLKSIDLKFVAELMLYNLVFKPLRPLVRKGINRIVKRIKNIPPTDKVWVYDTKPSLTVIFQKQWFEKQIFMPFEDMNIALPNGYHEVLKTTYGNYMTPPPANQQISQHYRYFIDLTKGYTRAEIMQQLYGKKK